MFQPGKEPVKWDYSSKKIDESTYEISLTANVDPSWHIYSQNNP
jgi:thiol:disulfide interchange protein DsbD